MNAEATPLSGYGMAPPPDYGGAENASSCREKPIDGQKLLKMSPSIFTLICCLLFGVPAWIVLTITHNPSVEYFSQPQWVYLVLLIPLLIVVVHVEHERAQAPSRIAVAITLIVPSLMLLGFSNAQYMQSLDMTDKLFSASCNTFPAKQRLQRAWEDAYNLYVNCLNDTVAASASRGQAYSIEGLMRTYRIEDCTEYQAALTGYGKYGERTGEPAHAREWNYLKYLEETEHCSGWCYRGQQLWSSDVTKDHCSVVVANVYDNLIRPHASQVSNMMLTCIPAVIVMLLIMGPWLWKHTEW